MWWIFYNPLLLWIKKTSMVDWKEQTCERRLDIHFLSKIRLEIHLIQSISISHNIGWRQYYLFWFRGNKTTKNSIWVNIYQRVMFSLFSLLEFWKTNPRKKYENLCLFMCRNQNDERYSNTTFICVTISVMCWVIEKKIMNTCENNYPLLKINLFIKL